ncbi:response regulator [Chryseobacterium populi]|uniref:Response regulator containing a CheY-like receiver domain and an HTH DNA-binding domain n=1 Tax=Chryseobacterium populi TaxID=1144316 RepID=J2KRY8_9FLAO|nr:response regulator transcription factor [Chryseobacterium populi]EJL75813.1 response regulator containing a CheY-like receiver domain and an HTH DNA-binding domain [Chryseobacterium populi]
MFKNKKIKVALVDDHPILAQGIKSLLAKENDIFVVGSFSHGLEFLSFLQNNDIDMVLLDISLPDINGVELCLKVKTMRPEICVLALSNYSEKMVIIKMLQNGASGYMLKNESVEELKICIDSGMNGEMVFSKGIKEIMARPSINNTKEIPKITRREKQILKLIEDGKTTAMIADELFISPLTVETHRKNLMQKFNAKNSLELIKIINELYLF